MTRKRDFLNRNLHGEAIDQRHKDSHSVEVDGQSRFCGHRFLLKKKLYGDKRCIYCGRWFHWQEKDREDWVRTGNIDPYNHDSVIEPLHCGSSHCQEYHKLSQEAENKRTISREDRDRYFFSMFSRMQQRKIVV